MMSSTFHSVSDIPSVTLSLRGFAWEMSWVWKSLEGLYVYYISNDERYHEKCPAHGLFYKHPFGIDKGNERYKKIDWDWLGVLITNVLGGNY